MQVAADAFDEISREHRALMQDHGQAQLRCSEQLRAQAREIERLHAQAMRLRAEVMVRETALAWAREERDAFVPVSAASPRPGEAEALEASLSAADLVICQTGCLSHGAFWRVQDHCKRTGKACVLVDAPRAVRIVRIQHAE